MGSAQLSVKELGLKPGANAGIWVHAPGLSYPGRRWTDSRGWTMGAVLAGRRAAEVSAVSCLAREGLRPAATGVELLAPLPPFVPSLLSPDPGSISESDFTGLQTLLSRLQSPFLCDYNFFFFLSFFFLPFWNPEIS